MSLVASQVQQRWGDGKHGRGRAQFASQLANSCLPPPSDKKSGATAADKETVNRRSPWFGAGTTVKLGERMPAGRRRRMSGEPDEALEVLRGIWSAQGQTSADLDEIGTGKSCKRMADVGFGEVDGAEDDLRAGWRDRVGRGGKLSKGGSVAGPGLGPAQQD